MKSTRNVRNLKIHTFEEESGWERGEGGEVLVCYQNAYRSDYYSIQEVHGKSWMRMEVGGEGSMGVERSGLGGVHGTD